MRLNDIVDILEQNFPEDWSFDDFIENEEEFFASMSEIVKNIYQKLNLIIFSGEYVNRAEIENTISNKIIPIVDRIVVEADNANEETLDTSESLQSFILTFQNNSIGHLRNLCQIVQSNIIKGEQSLLSGFRNYEGASLFNVNQFGINEEARFFEINCEVAKYDHIISVKSESLKNLIIQLEILQNEELNVYFKDLLIDKCKFLISKISEKIGQDKKSYFYTFDFQDREIENFGDEVVFFKEFSENKFYGNSLKKEYEKRIKSLKKQKKENKAFSLADIYFLIKHYKDENKNLSQITNLVKDYEAQFNNPDFVFEEYEKRTREIAYNYLVNNKFSYLLHINSNWDEILDYLEVIETIQVETNVNNYFPFLRFLKAYSADTKKILEPDNFNSNLIETRLKILNEKLQKLYEKYEWCLDSDFQKFILDKESCTIEIDYRQEKYKVFLASSYILPINYEKVQNECEDLKREIEDIQSHYSIWHC